ncbi:MAG: tetratricopeptide repeat protein [Pseudomonadales bacterium]
MLPTLNHPSLTLARSVGGVVVAMALMLTGCAAQPRIDTVEALDYPPWLLSGERLFERPIVIDEEVPDVAVQEASDVMRAYVERLVTSEGRLASRRFRQLLAGLSRDGFFRSTYSAHRTLTAAETFEARNGNCLSYTNMFIALAREAGLDAVYQVVDVPPSWDADAGFLIRYTHINVLIKNLHLGGRYDHSVNVDFNDVLPALDYPRREVSDEYAKALYFANQSVALLRAGQSRASFGHLRRAIETDPGNADLWINLGAFYATEGDFAASVEAYKVALQIDGNNKPALSGLARNYANAGDLQQAAFYREKVRNYRETNPFYHFAMAQAAFDAAEFERSLDYINAAIGLNRRTARFHLLKGLVEQKLGDYEAAESSFRRARRHGLEASDERDLMHSLVGMNAS